MAILHLMNPYVLAAGSLAALLLGRRVVRRLQLSIAKHPSLQGHSQM